MCVLDCPPESTRCNAECSDPDGKNFTLPITGANNFIAMPPRDAERLLEFCKRRRGD